MAELPAGRQWMVPELHQTLKDAGVLPDWLGHWHLASLLRRSGGQVAYLGRLRVALLSDGNRQERIHHQDAVLSVLEEAGEPLSIASIAERVRRRTDVRDDTLSIRRRSPILQPPQASRQLSLLEQLMAGARAPAPGTSAGPSAPASKRASTAGATPAPAAPTPSTLPPDLPETEVPFRLYPDDGSYLKAAFDELVTANPRGCLPSTVWKHRSGTRTSRDFA